MMRRQGFSTDELRRNERARFERWFVETPAGTAFVAGPGQPRIVRPEELRRWRGQAYARIDEWAASVQTKGLWAAALFVGTFFLGQFLFGLLGFDGTAKHVATSVLVVTVEVGLLAIEVHDYFAYWRDFRAEIEAALVGRPPAAIDAARARAPRNWFEWGKNGVFVLLFLLYLASHIDEGIFEWAGMYWIVLLAPLAWIFHLAARWHDGAVKDRMQR